MENGIATVKIDIKDTTAIKSALDAVNGRSAAFTITSAKLVQEVSEGAERDLYASLPKSAFIGARASYTPSGPAAKSYKNSAISTRIVLERRTEGWVMIAVERTTVYPRSSESLQIFLSAEQHLAAAIRAVAQVKGTFVCGKRKEDGADADFINAAARKAGIKSGPEIGRGLLSFYAR